MRRRERRDVEPGEVRRFLRQELLKKVGYSDWVKPRLYRYDLAEEREPTPSVQSVVVIPSDPDQPEAEHEAEASQDQEPNLSDVGPVGRMVLAELVSSPVTSLPRTPRRDIYLPGEAKESPRSQEGRVAVATLEQEMGRHSVAEADTALCAHAPRQRSLGATETMVWETSKAGGRNNAT